MKKMNDHNLIPNPVKKGQVLNPNGKAKGTKNAMTIVREFMDKKIESLKGTKVSRFQCLLWHMYDIARQLQKQADRYQEEYERMRLDVESFSSIITSEEELEEITEASKMLKKKKHKLNVLRNKYEGMLEKVQNAHIRLSEFFIKSSGQLIEKKEIENKGAIPATIVSVSQEDLKEAVDEINNEL